MLKKRPSPKRASGTILLRSAYRTMLAIAKNIKTAEKKTRLTIITLVYIPILTKVITK